MRPTAVRVVLADDHPLFLRAIEEGLEQEGFEVVGLAASIEQLLAVVAEVEPDVVLLDLGMPGADGVSCVRELRTWYPKTMIVMLSGHDDPATIGACLEAGAMCFIGKQAPVENVADALRTCLAPEIRFREHRPAEAPSAAPQVGPTSDLLTPRENEILRIVSTGLSNGEIARALWVTEQTVKFHLSNIFRKLEVTNRTEAARRGVELGLVDYRASTGPDAYPERGRSSRATHAGQ